MSSDVVKAQSVFGAAQALQRPQLYRKVVRMRVQPCASDGRQKTIGRVTEARAVADSDHSVSDADVIAHALNLFVALFVDPWEPLKFWIELGPLFQRLWLAQSHVECALKIRRAGIRRVNVAVEFCIRKSSFNVADQCNRLALVGLSFIREGEDERKCTSNI